MHKTLFSDLKAMLFQYRWRFTKAFIMVLISNGLLILNPLVFRQAVIALDPHSGKPNPYLAILFAPLGNLRDHVWTWAIILITIALTSAYFKFWMRVEFISVSRDVEREVRSKLFNRIQYQSMAFFDRHGIGELLSRLTNDISAYRDVLGPGIMYPLYFSTMIIPGLIALYSISHSLTSISLIPLIVIPIINISIRRPIYSLSHKVQKLLADLSNMVQEHYSAIRIIKSYVVESSTFHLFYKLCSLLVKYNMRLISLMGLIFPLFTLLTRLVTVLLLLFSGIIILKAWSSLSVADFVSFMWLQSYIFFPLLMLAWVLPIYQRGRAAYDRLRLIYEEPIEVQDMAKKELHIPLHSDIEIKKLSFAYPETERKVLNNFNLHIKGGTFLGITGPIGSGKSTLFHLINREYEIPKGHIYIDGKDIHEYPLESFRNEIVTVEQTPFLFSKTIAENVRFGREEASQQELEMVAAFADLHETILTFPQGYDTLIGERGVTLSGGQKQRVAMARAFLVNRSILLLDDIFSAVDTATEHKIFTAMNKNFRGKTVLLITHRVSILEQMDRIIYMQNGKILEDGTHKELIKMKGHYAALAELQSLGADF